MDAKLQSTNTTRLQDFLTGKNYDKKNLFSGSVISSFYYLCSVKSVTPRTYYYLGSEIQGIEGSKFVHSTYKRY